MGEETYVTEAHINPAIQTGSVTPTWQTPYERGAIAGLFTIVDVTGTGPPAASAATIPHFYLDTEIPRAWVTRTQREYTQDPVGTFGEFTDPGNYVGDYRGQPPGSALTANGQYWYRHGTTHAWYRYDGSRSHQVSASTVLGATTTWLGDAADADVALRRIDNFDNARRYLFFNEANDRVEELDNSTYMAQTLASLSYAMSALALEEQIPPRYETGAAFPPEPQVGQLFEFNTAVSGLTDALDFDGMTAVTDARRGDVFRWNDTNWIKQSASGDAAGLQAEIDDLERRVAALEGGTTQTFHFQAAVSVDTALNTAEINAGTSTTTRELDLPAWTGNVYVFVGTLATAPDITDIELGGISRFSTYQRVPGTIGGLKWWRSRNPQSQLLSGQTLTISQ